MIKIFLIVGIVRSKIAASSDKCDSYLKSLDKNCSNDDDKDSGSGNNNWAVIPYSDSINSNAHILPLFSVKQRKVKIRDLDFSFDQDWDGSGVAGVVWDASLSLAEYLLDDWSLEGKFILELGSGASAIPSLVCASKGALVTATDLPKNMAILKKNIRQNRPTNAHVDVKALDWTKKEQYFTPPAQNFDLILGADVIYDESLFDHLIQIFKFYGTLDPKTEILLAIRFRYERERNFLNLVEKSGFDVHEKKYDKIRDIFIYSVTKKR